jgi:hypothetical protein
MKRECPRRPGETGTRMARGKKVVVEMPACDAGELADE